MWKILRAAPLLAVGLLTALSLPSTAAATTAPTTEGSAEACVQYLREHGYPTTDRIEEGCQLGEDSSVLDACYDVLTFGAGIPDGLALEACKRAATPPE